jgi:hypothetical protein
MTPDEIINSAFDRGGMLPDEGLFILEGNPERNMFRVLPAEKAFTDNLNCFLWGVNTGFQYLGTYISEQEAQEIITRIRQKLRDEEGNRLV